jgi:hypothetical protein
MKNQYKIYGLTGNIRALTISYFVNGNPIDLSDISGCLIFGGIYSNDIENIIKMSKEQHSVK